MGTLLDALKTLKLWQVGVMATVLIAVAGATYIVYAMATSSGSTDLSEDQQLIPVLYGNVVNQVSTNGSLAFVDRETLTFGSQGTVGEVLVSEGQEVHEWQTLATLDTATVTSLQKSVAQVRVNLKNAQDALAAVKTPVTSLAMAQAEAKVANAELSLQTAQEAVDTVKAGPTAADLAKAEARVDSAKASLVNAEQDLRLGQKDWDDKIETARNLLSTAKADYQEVFPKWLGIQIRSDQVDLAPDTVLASWQVDLNVLFDSSLRFQDFRLLRPGTVWNEYKGLSFDDPSTPWSESVVYTWLNLYFGELLPTCLDGDDPAQGICIEKDMDDAWTTYQNAKDNLDAVQTQASKAIINLQNNITLANDSVTTKEDTLADLEAGPDTLEVDVSGKQLVVAQATLEKAEVDLANLKESIPLDVANKEADVASAQAALDTALQRLNGATLKAPTAGVVSLVNVEAGRIINANTTIVEVVDPSTVELNGVVDEIDVLFVRVGASASVTMDALQDQTLEGTVSSVASAPQSQQGVVSYPITIELQVPVWLDLREGLSATARIVIREETNVLRVPLQALYGTFDQPVVKVMSNGLTEERPVILGNSDDYWVAVRQGLAEGDHVVMDAQQATARQFSPGQALRQFGRGQGGGGGNSSRD
jgi:RND family efflux transporter MFP subunit